MKTMLKKTVWFLCVAALLSSCEKPEKEPEESGLDPILNGYVIAAIAFDSKGNAWIGTMGDGLIRYNPRETKIYNSKNSIFSEDSFIWDIAVDKNDNVWIGTSEGVWKHDGKEFTLYNSQNTAMPEDIVWSIAVDSKNHIWMASNRRFLGGLVKYDGVNWVAYTPDNSPLPSNSVRSITIDKSDNVWLAMSDPQVYLVKISNDKWNFYGEKELGFRLSGTINDIQFDKKNRLWGVVDYSLLSVWVSPLPHFFIFDGQNTTILSCGEGIRLGLFPKITIDKDDYIWGTGVAGIACGVWIDEHWIPFSLSDFGGSSVRTIGEAPDGKLWFGTENGIYIRTKQQLILP